MLAHLLMQQQSDVPMDTTGAVVVQTPLPRGVGAFVRFLFNLPSWLQFTLFALGVIVAIGVVVWLVVRRRMIAHWLGTRSRGWKLGLAAAALLVATGTTALSAGAWNYMQHNNDFCIGCHVMGQAWERFQHSEHRKLQCHDCHRQSIYASMRQLYLWVAERPASIPPHAKVPTRICQECHQQTVADSTWKRIIGTAGHSVHLRSDSSALRNIQCVTCHGAEVHHFVPIDKTCGQSGCHEHLEIKLGKMAGQTSLHCTGCHAFTTPVRENLSPDSARTSLVPAGSQCLECHAMKERMRETLAEFDPAKEPHGAVCGTCHNPHKQETPKDAFRTCATGACHARADTLTPFHRGLPRGALANCGTCHAAHVWTVRSTECLACHRELEHGRGRSGAPVPPRHATVAPAARAAATAGRPAESVRRHLVYAPRQRVHGPRADDDDGTPPAGESSGAVAPFPLQQTAARQQSDTARFLHGRHRSIACTACHSASREHGQVTLRRPAGCQSCHHSTSQRATCTTCHAATSLPTRTVDIAAVTTVRTTPTPRSLAFRHDEHGRLACRSCHTASRTLAVERDCTSCHAEHHAATDDAACVTCHAGAGGVASGKGTVSVVAMRAAHPREETHAGCGGSGCHRDAAVLALAPARRVCLTCHVEQTNHKPGEDCAGCHLVRWRTASAATSGGGR